LRGPGSKGFGLKILPADYYMQRRRLVAGNWKMNGSLEAARELVSGIINGMMNTGSGCEVVVFPPFPYLGLIQDLAKGSDLGWGGQNLSDQVSGAYTGEIAAEMLLEFGCRYVLTGHSERRSYFGDSDQWVAAKVARAQQASLVPVLCVGETLEQREAGETEAIVAAQIDAVLERVGIAGFGQLVVAYEPVWAIGTGRTASPQQAQDVHAFIRSKLGALNGTIADQIRILYGGSVKGANAAELFGMQDIDGGLIGGASLTHGEFLKICLA
jgi:triosephosphate isomerase